MKAKTRLIAISAVAILVIALIGTYSYQNGTFSSYSSWVTSCTYYTDVISSAPSQNCSVPQPIPLQPQSVIANGQTLYDTNPASPTYGKSNALTKDARITLSVGNANPSAISGTFICSALVDGKVAVTSPPNATTFNSLPSAVKVCSISIDGKTLQTQYFSPSVSTHIISMAFSGKVNYVYPTGAIQSRSFSGSLGNITVTITAPPATTTTTSTSTQTSSSSSCTSASCITVNNDKIPISGGGGSTVYSSSQTVSAPTASLTTNPTDYTKQATQIITQTNSYTTPQPVTVNGQTLNVPAGQIGSGSYVPNGSGGGTVTVTVTNTDIQTYQRGATQVENQFGGYANMTPYSKCVYLSQC